MPRTTLVLACFLFLGLSPAAAAAATGSIAGTVTYGSEYLPAWRIYAISAEDPTRFHAVTTKRNQERFVLPGVAPGRYVVVAYPVDENLPLQGAGWIRDGALVPVTVTAGTTATGVVVQDPFDHLPDDFPAEPPPTPGINPNAPSCGSRSPQIAIGYCHLQAWKIADRALNREYRRAMALENLEPRCREALRTAQRAWIAFRDAQCDYEGEAREKGRGSECLAELTVRRVRYLEQQDENLCLR